MSEEKKPDPFDPYVQELQGQEDALDRKLEIIDDLIAGDPKAGRDPIKQTEDQQSELTKSRNRLAGLRKRILEKKKEDLGRELDDLEELLDNPEGFTPPDPQSPVGPQPPWWPPFWPWPPVWPMGGGSSSSSSNSSSSSSGAVDGKDETPKSAATVTIGTKERDFIMAKSRNSVWVWHPLDQQWVARLDTGGEIVDMEKVDGSVAVRTADRLWLFNPLRYSWMGPLEAQVDKVEAYTLKVPTPVKKE